VRVSSVPAFALLAFAAGCGGASQTYTVGEAKDAFASQGYMLESREIVVAEPGWFGYPPRDDQAVLSPRESPRLFVVVGSDADVDAAWPDYERMQDTGSFDARRANIAVIADDGPPPRDRRRVLAALRALPDRGDAVDVAGD
jgi:hypothetical protein